jgi:lysine 2,3-aminomutase
MDAALMTKPLVSLDQLAAARLVAPEDAPALAPVAARYAVSISPALAALIDADDPADPIARQFLPSVDELTTTADERADPIGDKAHSPVPGVVHRYRDRALLKIVSVCPVYCRFCFRREMVGPGRENTLSRGALARALDYFADHPEIREVILTGGDPFVLSARRAADVTQRLAAIPHVKTLRWHTRVPVVEPSRVTKEYVRALTTGGVKTVVAIHANHPRELTPEARAACARLRDAGIRLLSQSVLLRGVNDSVETLAPLLCAFEETGIEPYYLHHPDLAPGTAHFRLGIEEGRVLMRELRARAPGVRLPKYVLDLPGGFGKVPLESECARRVDENTWQIRDPNGRWHAYPPPRVDPLR